ncbi:MAG: FecR family protein [Pseudomonadota bacterium]
MNMKLLLRQAGLLFALGFFQITAHAVSAGRVLVAVGDVSATRNGATIKLTAGAAIESGDVIHTGSTSNTQLRFTDGAIVALRPETEFAVESYSFKGAESPAKEEKSFFSLLKGGLRTITGLIGKRDRDAYRMKTATATVGIRGTHYNLVFCQQNCRNSDGSLARDGLYGGVLDGAIALKNEAQERVFGRDEVFYVADANTPPQQLLAPPQFLRDRLDGQARTKEKGQEAGETQEARTESQPEEQQVAVAPVESPRTDENPVGAEVAEPEIQLAQDELSETVEQNAGGGGVLGGDGVAPAAGTSSIFLSAEYNPSGGAHNASNSDTDTTVVVDGSGIVNTSHYQRGTASSHESGADGGAIVWGRWAGGTAFLYGWGNQTLTADQGFHIIYGTIPTSAPAQDSVSFSLIGATRPTEATNAASGNVWSVTSGSVTANFLSQTFSGSLGLGLNSSSGQSAYAMSFSSNVLNVTSTNGWSGTVSHASGAQNVCGAGCSANGTLIFAGPTATHAGTTYEFGMSNGVYVQGAAAFKR